MQISHFKQRVDFIENEKKELKACVLIFIVFRFLVGLLPVTNSKKIFNAFIREVQRKKSRAANNTQESMYE